MHTLNFLNSRALTRLAFYAVFLFVVVVVVVVIVVILLVENYTKSACRNTYHYS